MYKFIINPQTKRKVSIYSKKGKNIILNYIEYLKKGGAYSDEQPASILEKILQTRSYKKLYVSLHGDNYTFITNPTQVQLRDPEQKDMKNLTIPIPYNLIVIHFFQKDFCGFCSEESDIHIKQTLANQTNWMNTQYNNSSKIIEPSRELTLNDTAHLFYPGDEIYNSRLSFEWTNEDKYIDIYELNLNSKYKDERYDEISLRPNTRHQSRRRRVVNTDGYPESQGLFISRIQADSFEKKKDFFSMEYLLKRISKETELSHEQHPQAHNKYRLIYIYNCDPKIETTLNNILDFKKIDDTKKKIEKQSKEKWRDFLKNDYTIPSVTRTQKKKNKIMHRTHMFIDDDDDIDAKISSWQKHFQKQKDGQEMYDYGYGVISGAACKKEKPCNYYGNQYIKKRLQNCIGSRCLNAKLTCLTYYDRNEICKKGENQK